MKKIKRTSTHARRRHNRTESKLDCLFAPKLAPVAKVGPNRAARRLDKAHAHALSLQAGEASLRIHEIAKARLAILANPNASIELRVVARAQMEGRNVTYSGGPKE